MWQDLEISDLELAHKHQHRRRTQSLQSVLRKLLLNSWHCLVSACTSELEINETLNIVWENPS